MSTCSELRDDLLLLAHATDDGASLDPVRAADVRAHVAACPVCAAEVALLRGVFGVVRDATEIEPTPGERAALLAALDAELAAPVADARPAGRLVRSGAWARLYDSALARYESSARFRRVAVASVVVHVAAAALIAWVLVSEHGPLRRPHVGIEQRPEVARLEEFPKLLGDETQLPPRSAAELDESALPQYQDWSPAGVDLPEIFRTPTPAPALADGQPLTAPTVGILIRLRAATVEETRDDRARQRVGDLAPRIDPAVEGALRWLAERAGDDGRFGRVPGAGEEDFRDGVTGAVVLAFVQNGRSPRDEAFGAVLRPAVAALEARLRDGPAAADPKPLYSTALALRALTWQWALDYRNLDVAARSERHRLLEQAGQALLAAQNADGGFGYRPGDARSDASCTLFATAALADLRLAGVVRADASLRRAGTFLAGLRAEGGLQSYREPGDRADDPALTAALLAYARELGVRGDAERAVEAVRTALADGSRRDALLAWTGLDALRRRPELADSLRPVLAAQRPDGSWSAANDRHCRVGGDELATALGVLAVTRVYTP